MSLAVSRHMRTLLLAAVAIGSGCAAHESAWKVRTADNWPVQTWDADPDAVVATHHRRCTVPQEDPPGWRWDPTACCDPPLALDDYDSRAERCKVKSRTSHRTKPVEPPTGGHSHTPHEIATSTTTVHGGPRARR
jgi:hypothetical protein